MYLLDVRNPWCADRGEGCEVLRMWCLLGFTDFAFYWAGFPHSKKTTPLHCSLITEMT